MTADRVLDWTATVVFEEMGVQFSQLTREIFTLAWHGETYEQIAHNLGYEESYVRDVGSQLFRALKPLFGESIDKRNFRRVLSAQYKSQTTSIRVEEELPSNVATSNSHNSIYPGRANLVGRKQDLETLHQNFTEHAIVLVHGEGGIGKTTLARKYLELYEYRVLPIWMPAESPRRVTPVEMVIEEWLQGEFGLDSGCDFGINLDRLRRCLQQAQEPIGVLIDNLESALDGHGHFIQEHRGYLDLLRLLSDQSLNMITIITSRQSLQESSITPHRYRLMGLDQHAWRKYFRRHNIQIKASSLEEVWRGCLGNPKAMEILKGTAIVEFDGDLEAYWQSCDRNLLMNGSVQHLVQSQVSAVAEADPNAYKLLCRLGIYRYQNIPAISLTGVKAMLWDVAETEQQALMQTLRGRSLLEARRNQKFWLHPMIHSEVQQRLRKTDDWEKSHRQAGQFWLAEIDSIDTVEQAQKVLEAYHHYVEIAAYEDACNVLITPKPNRWNHAIEVGWLFYRFSLLQQITTAIQRIIEHIPTDSRAGRLYNLLGYVTRLCGEPLEAITHHKNALNIAQKLRQQKEPQLLIKQLEASALFNLGLCYRDLWELSTATDYFQQVKQLATAVGVSDYVTYANCCLAFIYSNQNDRTQAIKCIEQVPVLYIQSELTYWGKACSMLYLASSYCNLGELEAAIELYQDTIYFAQNQQFTHIIANAYHGLAKVNRLRGNYDTALEQHAFAIDQLQQITAKCDLAEAHLQRGLTYRTLQQTKQSQADLQIAVALLAEIKAPKRLERLYKLADYIAMEEAE